MFKGLLLPLCAVICFSSCSKEEDPPVTPAPSPPATPIYEPTFDGDQGVQMSVNGEVITLVQGGSLIPFYFADGEQNDPPQTSWRLYHSGIHNGSIAANVFELQMGTLSYVDVFFAPTLFQDYFDPGEREFGVTTVPGIEKVAIVYTDPDGVVWSTQQGSAVQNNSTFIIQEKQAGTDDQGVWVKIIATFNCTIYSSGGLAEQITDGELMLEFRDY